MPHTIQLEIIYQDMGVFAKAIVPKRTYWSLKELIEKADLPKGVKLVGDLKVESYDEFRDAGIEDIQVYIDRYYDKDGTELIRKSKTVSKVVTATQQHEVFTYEEPNVSTTTTPGTDSRDGGDVAEHQATT